MTGLALALLILISSILKISIPQEPAPWLFNEGIHRFSDKETERLRQAVVKVRSKTCKDWFESTLAKLGKPDLPGVPAKTIDKLFEFSNFSRYTSQLTASDMNISPAQRADIASKYDDRWTNLSVANAVTLGPDYTRIYLMPSAFFQDTNFAPYSGRDLSGIIAFELFHVAGFSDKAVWHLRVELQRHCGNPSDNL